MPYLVDHCVRGFLWNRTDSDQLCYEVLDRCLRGIRFGRQINNRKSGITHLLSHSYTCGITNLREDRTHCVPLPIFSGSYLTATSHLVPGSDHPDSNRQEAFCPFLENNVRKQPSLRTLGRYGIERQFVPISMVRLRCGPP
jgi:hypothetical protein